jgi:TPR repeat protein
MSLPAVDRPHRVSCLAACVWVALFAGLPSGSEIAAADVSGTVAVDVIEEQAATSPEPLDALRAPAEQCDLSAQVRLGDACVSGEGVEVNPAEAASWYRRAAERGDTDAQIKLASLYRTGAPGIDRDLLAALRWLTPLLPRCHPENVRRTSASTARRWPVR